MAANFPLTLYVDITFLSTKRAKAHSYLLIYCSLSGEFTNALNELLCNFIFFHMQLLTRGVDFVKLLLCHIFMTKVLGRPVD